MSAQPKICGVYRFVHIPSGKCYVGSGVNVYDRKRIHINSAKEGTGCYFHKSLKRLGVENFVFEVVEICEQDIKFEREKYFIKFFNSIFPNGFNICSDPTIFPGRLDVDRCKFLSELHKGNQHTKGRKLSTEHKAAIGAKLRAWWTPERRIEASLQRTGKKRPKSLSDSLKGNKRALGNKLSPDTRMRMSIAKAGHPPSCTGHTLKTRKKMSKSHKARWRLLKRQKQLKN